MFNIIALIVCSIGTIAAAYNASNADSIWGLLFWFFSGAITLIGTILQAIQIFA